MNNCQSSRYSQVISMQDPTTFYSFPKLIVKATTTQTALITPSHPLFSVLTYTVCTHSLILVLVQSCFSSTQRKQADIMPTHAAAAGCTPPLWISWKPFLLGSHTFSHTKPLRFKVVSETLVLSVLGFRTLRCANVGLTDGNHSFTMRINGRIQSVCTLAAQFCVLNHLYNQPLNWLLCAASKSRILAAQPGVKSIFTQLLHSTT